jgi:ankyrin repeat protein
MQKRTKLVFTLLLGAICLLLGVNIVRRTRQVRLATAIERNDTAQVLDMLKLRLPLTFVCKDPKTGRELSPLAYAVSIHQNVEVAVALLEAGAKPDNQTILSANRLRLTPLLQKMLDKGLSPQASFNPNEQRPSLINLAAQAGNLALVQNLVQRGVSVNTYDVFHGGFTPLMHAAQLPTPDMTRFLLSQGAKVNIINAVGGFPLTYAVEKNALENVRLLLKAQAFVNGADSVGRTPLMIAAKQGESEIVQMLIAYKADTQRVSRTKETALSLAKPYPQIAIMLRKAGAKR